MNDSVIPSLEEKFEVIDVRSEQVRLLYSATLTSLLTILLNSIILAYVQWEVIASGHIILWFLLTNSLSLVRLVLYLRFKKLDTHKRVDKSWYQAVMATSILSGLTWGAGSFILFAEQSLVHQVFLAFVIAGMCAGAITTLTAEINAARLFVASAIIPLTIQFIIIDSSLSTPMAVMTGLFGLMLLVSAKRLNHSILESLNSRQQRELAEQTIRRQALYDELTDLPNRRLFLDNLRQELSSAIRHRRFGAVFFVDLDRFKSINDSLGHAVGDKLLKQVAQRIKSRLRNEDTAARIGGDEFTVLLPDVGRNQELATIHATDIADQIRQLFEAPFNIEEHEIHMTLSIGIALFPLDATADDLLKHADVAMYQAKNDGRNSVRLFSADMQDAINQHRIIEKGLRKALAKNQFELYLQAQFDSDNNLVGAETLIRWNHPEKGIVAPGYFIETAEQTGLIVAMGEWILRSACEHLAKIDTAGGFILSVNVSPRQFSDEHFVERLKLILQQSGANPRSLMLEITEGLAIANLQKTIDTMNQLKALGVSFSVDDFGTGYSSLSYLTQLPVDELKIDQSFVRNISTSPENAIIVETIIVMARHLNLKVVAEGVETEIELSYLKAHNCHFFQGYYFARPEPFDEFQKRLGN